MASKPGLGSLPAGLIRPTTNPTPAAETAEADPGAEPVDAAEQGRGDAAVEGPARATRKVATTRKPKPPAEGETRGRKLSLPDSIHDRLWQRAREKRSTVSAVAAEILDKNLPRYRVEREG